MKIVWYGGNCFRVSDSEKKVFVGDVKGVDVKGQLVLTTDEAAAKGAKKVFSWPGEYEMSDIPVNAFEQGGTVIFAFNFNGVRFCHLGGLKEPLIDDFINRIGDVDVLFINLGSDAGIKKEESVAIVESVEPRVVIAMGDGDLQSAAKALGASVDEVPDKYEIKSAGSLPSDKMDYVVLQKK